MSLIAMLYVILVQVFLSCPRNFMICLIWHLWNHAFWMFFCSIMLCKNLWGELMMFISWLKITLSLLIFFVLDIECNASCPIVLGRPFLRTVGAIIDMKEGNIKYQFPLVKGMEPFPRKRIKSSYDSIIRTNYFADASSLGNTWFIIFLCLAERH